MPENIYTLAWFDTFLRTYWPQQTAKEIDFVARQLPQPAYQTILDVCCGLGRHALPLAARGYRVTSVDRDAAIIAEAQRDAGDHVHFVEGDMRDLVAIPGAFDAVLCLWQSFGYFDAPTNIAVLRQMRNKLNANGRLMLDIYHRDFFVTHQGTVSSERAGTSISTITTLNGDRLTSRIEYGHGPQALSDTFEWQLYTPEEISVLAESLGLRIVLCCTNFDEAQPPAPANPRMQLVFEKC